MTEESNTKLIILTVAYAIIFVASVVGCLIQRIAKWTIDGGARNYGE